MCPSSKGRRKKTPSWPCGGAWTGPSPRVNLLTGYRGNGKSTELRRLKHLLETKSGAKVFLVNMLEFLLMTKPLEPSDFVLSLMAALGQAVEQETGLHALTQGYWERLHRFLTTEVKLENLKLDLTQVGAPVKLGLKLKNEPDFKERVQQHLRGHLSRLIEDAHAYVADLVEAIREEAKDRDLKVVLLVDSVEQIRGVGTEATQVQTASWSSSPVRPPASASPSSTWSTPSPPSCRPWPRTWGAPWAVTPSPPGPMCMCATPTPPASKSWRTSSINAGRTGATSIPPDTLRRLAASTGGDLRDFFRLIRECAVALGTARLDRPDAELDREMVNRVREQLRNELLPIAEDDARWLARIHDTKDTALPTTDDLPTLARFLDGNLIMNYLNGKPWYDIHPPAGGGDPALRGWG